MTLQTLLLRSSRLWNKSALLFGSVFRCHKWNFSGSYPVSSPNISVRFIQSFGHKKPPKQSKYEVLYFWVLSFVLIGSLLNWAWVSETAMWKNYIKKLTKVDAASALSESGKRCKCKKNEETDL